MIWMIHIVGESCLVVYKYILPFKCERRVKLSNLKIEPIIQFSVACRFEGLFKFSNQIIILTNLDSQSLAFMRQHITLVHQRNFEIHSYLVFSVSLTEMSSQVSVVEVEGLLLQQTMHHYVYDLLFLLSLQSQTQQLLKCIQVVLDKVHCQDHGMSK